MFSLELELICNKEYREWFEKIINEAVDEVIKEYEEEQMNNSPLKDLAELKSLKIKPNKKGFTDAPITLLYSKELNAIETYLSALEIINEKMKPSVEERISAEGKVTYWLFMNLDNRPKEAGWRITEEQYNLLREVVSND